MTQNLIQAAERGDAALVQQLLRDGADLNGRDGRGRTPIMAATHGNRPAIVQILVQAGADINLQDEIKDNPFLYAGAEGRLEVLKLLIDARADTRITNRFGGTALIPAAERGHVEVVQELLSRTNVKIDHVNNLGWTALIEAVILGDGGSRHQKTVAHLVKAGANKSIADRNGETPLMLAKERGYGAMVKLLE